MATTQAVKVLRNAADKRRPRQKVEYVASRTGTFSMPSAEVEAVGAKVSPTKDFGKQWRKWAVEEMGGTPATREDMRSI